MNDVQYDFNTKYLSRIYPGQSLKVGNVKRLIGGTFTGSVVDARYTSTVANGGTASKANGILTIQTNTTANGSAVFQSVKNARYQTGNVQNFSATAAFSNTGATNNIRRIGALNVALTDGYFFQLSGTTFSCVSRKAGVDTAVATGSFNIYATYTIDANFHHFEIIYGTTEVLFLIDGDLFHKLTATTALLSENHDLGLYASSVNSSSLATNQGVKISAWSISSAMGTDSNLSDYYHVGSVAETRTVVTGSGRLTSVTINTKATAAATITLYDNTAASGTIIAVIDLTQPGSFTYGIDFLTGLTYVTSGALSQSVTILFE